MITDQRILCVSNSSWEEPGELQVMIELLAGANSIVWVSPFGRINASLFPRITKIKDGLTIYDPGINYLPLPFLGNINRSRLLLQIRLYLLEIDFEPDLVIINSPELIIFVNVYRQREAKAIYYFDTNTALTVDLAERRKADEAVDLVFKCESLPNEISEEEYFNLIDERVSSLSAMIKSEF